MTKIMLQLFGEDGDAEGATVNLPIDSIVRVNCCGNSADLTIEISSAITTVNASMAASKL